ncbi:MAG: alpha/beta fold hydrolase [Phycisphaerales bacterium]
MAERLAHLAIAAGLMGLAVGAPAFADEGEAARLAAMLPPVQSGAIHPAPGLYLLAPGGAAASEDSAAALCELLGDESFEKAAPLAASAVVLVHGLDDSGHVWHELAPALHAAGRCVLFFEYPNDQAIAASADALGEALRDARARGFASVDLVCHSMGGLVARDVLSRDEFYAGECDGREDLPDVGQLILIGTPNAGAPLAYVRSPGDLVDHAMSWRRADAPLSAIFEFASDGSGQAGIDLRPGSAFLTDLNARPAPSGVETIVIIAHAAGVPDAGGSDTADEAPTSTTGRVRAWWRRVVAAIVRTLGDGAVPTDSAALASADETLHVYCTHLGLLKADPVGGWILGAVGDAPDAAPAVALVLARVGLDVPAPADALSPAGEP